MPLGAITTRPAGGSAQANDKVGHAVGANIYIYCPSGVPGLARCDLEEELEAFFGGAAEDGTATSSPMRGLASRRKEWA